MKHVYIVARNHMDPSWLRCFTDHFQHTRTGDVVRPYADVEEGQILEYMDFAERFGVVYQIEQSLVVKKFLERNPDQKDCFRALAQRGLLELAGGGEAVIDVNLTQGESWVRNHLYSRLYYMREFGRTPRYAITPDIFGLASQLPQFFRSLGYDALIVFDRVLKNNKPFWKGLDGTCIVLDPCFLQPPEPNLRTADCVKLPACPVCRGEGCAFCEGSGLDLSHNMTRPDKPPAREAYYGNMSAGDLLDRLLETEKDAYHVMITAEEPRVGDFLFGQLREAAARRGVRVHYVGFEENHDIWCPGLVQRLRDGEFTAEEIDTRPEGNPAGCGCYTSRVEIKKANRALEDRLIEAETLAALVRLHGGWRPETVPRRDYPAKKLEALWNKMAFIQFHDCVTGSHCDASYNELLRYIREVRSGAERICADAAAEFCKLYRISVPADRYAALLFNPGEWTERYPLLTVSAPLGTETVAVFDADGAPLPVVQAERVPALAGVQFSLRVRADVPPFGWRCFLWSPVSGENAAETAENAIENAWFRVERAADGRVTVFDIKNGRTAFSDVGLAVGADVGGPYGRSEPERDHRPLAPDAVRALRLPHAEQMILSGTVRDLARGIERLAWTQTLTLFEGEPLLRIRTTLDWNGSNTRVFASFQPAFDPADRLICEVPFGTMERNTPENTGILGLVDEWPSLGFAGVSAEGYNAAVLKGGLPATRLHDGKLQVSLLRAFTTDDPRYEKTNDLGMHTAEYALTAWTGAFSDGGCSSRAASYLRNGISYPLAAPGILREPEPEARPAGPVGSLFSAIETLPENLRISALKWAEEADVPVLRVWESAGVPALLRMKNGWSLLRCDLLENPAAREAAPEYAFRPFEIATFRLLREGND